METNEMVIANTWVVCSCGDKHRLIPGIDAPVYWCGDVLLKLTVGDTVEYEEVEG